MNCSVAQSLEVIGEWWTLLIVRDAFFGVSRFEEFQSRLGIARNILATRLETLVAAGILERRVYEEARGRSDYVLTEKGRALWPVLTALRQWGDDWMVGEGYEPVEMVHRTCGERARAEMVCGHCGERLHGRDLRVVPGPGSDGRSRLPVRATEPPGAG
jgi:DNA-binding HxlR family transcriptional regulator